MEPANDARTNTKAPAAPTVPMWMKLLLAASLAGMIASVGMLGLPLGLALVGIAGAILFGKIVHERLTPSLGFWILGIGVLGFLGAIGKLQDGSSPAPVTHVSALPSANSKAGPEATPPAQRPQGQTPTDDTFGHWAPLDMQPFTLVEVEPHPKRLPGLELPQTGVMARYEGQELPARLELLVQRNATEGIGEGKPMRLGSTDGVFNDRGEYFTVAWRSGDLVAVMWLYPKTKAAKRGTRKILEPAARAASAWTAQLAAGEFSPVDIQTRAQLVTQTLASETAAQLRANRKLERAMENMPQFVESARLRGDEFIVTVGASWHVMPKTLRREQARIVWQQWAQVNSPRDPDKSYLSIVDRSGAKLGGSGMAYGSSITVD